MAIASLSSCDLDLVPEDAIAYEEGKQLFLTANDVKSFENGVLSSYRSIHYGVFYYVPDLICDGFNAAVDYITTMAPFIAAMSPLHHQTMTQRIFGRTITMRSRTTTL